MSAKLRPHTFPAFYACYLLKSVRTLRSYKNYIGTTQDPVRRLRQHNGLVANGARETALHRPWIMQLLVHGFPSKPAAMKFEWAWQNPHNSRYFRASSGKALFAKRGHRLEQNVMILQKMICTYPFSTFPLHVKLFTEEAVRCWDTLLASLYPTFSSSVPNSVSSRSLLPPVTDLTTDVLTQASGSLTALELKDIEARIRHYSQLVFPPGFTCSIELEGVDGQSGLLGSGREGPLVVSDAHFSSPYLAKHTELVSSGKTPSCSVCHKPIGDFASSPLKMALCPTSGCTDTAHLTCLARSFLDAERLQFLSSSPLVRRTLSPPVALQRQRNPFGLGKGMIPRGGVCSSCTSYVLWGDIIKGCYKRQGEITSEEQVTDGSEELGLEDNEADPVLEEPSITTKRARGRPRKHVKELEVISETVGSKKRGRPKKEVIGATRAVAAQENKPKRNRGRPKKNNVAQTTSTTDDRGPCVNVRTGITKRISKTRKEREKADERVNKNDEIEVKENITLLEPVTIPLTLTSTLANHTGLAKEVPFQT